MIDSDTLEMHLVHAFGGLMTTTQRQVLDARVADIIDAARPAGRPLRIRLTRGLVLAIGLSLLAASAFGTWGAMKLSEAPYGMHGVTGYQAEITAAKATTPLPPGATWPAQLDNPPDANAWYGVGAGRAFVEFNAACIWFGYWLETSPSSGDRPQALTGVLAMRDWTTFSDPLVNGSVAYFDGLFAAAARGDQQPIREFVGTNCTD